MISASTGSTTNRALSSPTHNSRKLVFLSINPKIDTNCREKLGDDPRREFPQSPGTDLERLKLSSPDDYWELSTVAARLLNVLSAPIELQTARRPGAGDSQADQVRRSWQPSPDTA